MFDSITLLLIDIARHFLVEYFGHNISESETLLNDFIKKYNINEEYIHDNSSWRLSCAAHYCCHLGGDRGTLRIWEVENGYLNEPEDAIKYMKEKFWDVLHFDFE